MSSAATWHKINEVVTQNNDRELALMKRAGGPVINPFEILENKLEAFFKTILGDGRYLKYMEIYQDARRELLDQVESLIVQAEIRKGVADFNLKDAPGNPLSADER